MALFRKILIVKKIINGPFFSNSLTHWLIILPWSWILLITNGEKYFHAPISVRMVLLKWPCWEVNGLIMMALLKPPPPIPSLLLCSFFTNYSPNLRERHLFVFELKSPALTNFTQNFYLPSSNLIFSFVLCILLTKVKAKVSFIIS